MTVLSKLLAPKTTIPKEDHWIPLSDLMTGLMMMFMLVAIVFMLKVEADSVDLKKLKGQAEEQAARMRKVAVLYDELRDKLFQDLRTEFQADLTKWHAALDPDLSIRFEEPDVQFDTGKAIVKPQFKQILDDFFPRYAGILARPEYRDSIEEVRIEGHTSSRWNAQTPIESAYFLNMELSQSRTRTTLEYVLSLPRVAIWRRWLAGKLTANGLSSSHPRGNQDGTENVLASQRVEFRVRTNADSRIAEILRAAQQ